MPNVINLSTLTPEQGFAIQGEGVGDRVGWSVSSAGDVNGDGITDLIVGAPHGHNDAGVSVGEAYVIFGRAVGAGVVDLATLSPAQGFVIQGAKESDGSGSSVHSAGDVNGDGFADLIVGAPGNDDGGVSAGSAYVIFGHAGSFANLDLAELGDAGFVIQGDAAGDTAGSSVASAGDLNGDGFDDLVIGALDNDNGGNQAGAAYVVFGHAGAFADVDLSSLTAGAGFVIQGATAFNVAGGSVDSAGDFNGDGFADLIVGAHRAGDIGGAYTGEAYVIYGRVDGFVNVSLANLGDSGFAIRGGGPLDSAGYSVSSAGDINGDGFADIIVGATRVDGEALESGAAYVVFGHGGPAADIDLANLGAQGFVIEGITNTSATGCSVSSAGDVNGDGFADLIIGAQYATSGGYSTGEAYVVFGHAGAFSDIQLSTLTPDQGFIIRGGAPYDYAGRAVSSAGDINGDGFGDILVGAPGADGGGRYAAGDAYVVYGQAPAEAVTRTGTEVTNTILGGAFDDTLHGLGGNDTLEGGGGEDLLRGGAGNDTASYAHAAAGVSVRLNRALQDTGGAGADTFNSIENLTGSAFSDRLIGNSVANTLAGLDGADFLLGGEGRDILLGGGRGDMLDGGAGVDTMTGGVGHDRFRFDDGDLGITRALADVVTDFSQAEGDILRLNLVDADATLAGDQAFAWLGNGAFTGAAGQLHYVHQGGNTFVEGDLDGDSVADIFLRLDGLHTLGAGDFVL